MSNELPIADAARATGYTKARLYQMVEAGEIAFRRAPVTRYEVRLPRSVVEELTAKRQVKAAGHAPSVAGSE
jgi:hypothetical protein